MSKDARVSDRRRIGFPPELLDHLLAHGTLTEDVLGVLTAEMGGRRGPKASDSPLQAPSWEGLRTGRKWSGDWHLVRRFVRAVPSSGTAVVYFMYDDADDLAYIGSTSDFVKRVADHARDTSQRCLAWTHWSAFECETRLDAYVLEYREIKRLTPYQNMTPGAWPKLKAG